MMQAAGGRSLQRCWKMIHRNRQFSSSGIPTWATFDPAAVTTASTPYAVQNIVGGEWQSAQKTMDIINPLDRDAPPIFTIPDTSSAELQPFIDSLRACPKSGLHNPFKNPHRYVELGEVSRKVSHCVAIARSTTRNLLVCT